METNEKKAVVEDSVIAEKLQSLDEIYGGDQENITEEITAMPYLW